MPEPEPLPCENLDDGLYLHSVNVHTFTENARPCIVDREAKPVTRYYVDAVDFMRVQKERDDYRRACALVNAEEVGGRNWQVVQCGPFPDPWNTAWDTVVACSCGRRWVRRYCDGGFGGEACWVRLRWWHIAAHRGLRQAYAPRLQDGGE